MLDTADTMGALVMGASAAKQGATRRDLVLWFQAEYRARGFRHWSRGYRYCLMLAIMTYEATRAPTLRAADAQRRARKEERVLP